MRVLGFDTETRGLDWFDPEHGAFLISWAETGQPGQCCAIDDEAGVQCFRDAVERADALVAHNLPFDVHQVREAIGLDLLTCGKPLADTNILSRVVLPERLNAGAGYKLKDLAKTYVDPDAKDPEETIEEMAKAIGVKLKSTGGYYEVWRAYPTEMETYAVKDAEYVRDLYSVLLGKLTGRTTPCWELEQAVQPILIAAEQRGVKVDRDVVAKLRAEYEPLSERHAVEVAEVMGDVNLASPVQLREKLVELGVPLYRKTDKGELSTAAFALQEFEDQFPVLKALAQWRAADKMLGTYIGPMSNRDVVHTSFWQVGARTGRMSCSRPNMQNLPARKETADTKLREVFVPREGYAFVVCDYESIELKLLAYYLNDEEFSAKIAAGFGVFEWLAAGIWGGDASEYEKGTAGEKRRGDAKNVTYAIIYGAGIRRVSDMLNVPYEEGKRIVGKIKTLLPGYLDLAGTRRPKGRVPRKIEAEGFVTTLMGRKQVVGRDKSYVGLNALIQGSAADVFKQGVINAQRATAHLDAHPVLFVHDELVMECPVDNAEEVRALTTEAMCAAFDLTPALQVSGNICLNNYAEGK